MAIEKAVMIGQFSSSAFGRTHYTLQFHFSFVFIAIGHSRLSQLSQPATQLMPAMPPMPDASMALFLRASASAVAACCAASADAAMAATVADARRFFAIFHADQADYFHAAILRLSLTFSFIFFADIFAFFIFDTPTAGERR
jgi:hypothetical protein